MTSVLVVDDSPTVRIMFRRAIEAIAPPALDIVEAATAEEGIRKFGERAFDLTFLDGVFADGTPAIEVQAAMLDKRADARVIVMSSRPREHPDVVLALGVGAYAYLAKPVQHAALAAILERFALEGMRVQRIR